MKKSIGLIFFMFTTFTFFSQDEEVSLTVTEIESPVIDEESSVLTIPVADTILAPMIRVIHSMGDINVKGHQGSDLFVYAQELLPSVTELLEQSQTQVFSFIDQTTNRKVTVNQNNNFRVQQFDNLFQIETNMFSFSNHVFVLIPERSSVAIFSRDIGNISVENLQGEVNAEANSGNITLKNIGGTVSAATVHGNIIADQTEQDEIKPLFISTFIGNIEIITPKETENTVLLSSELGNLYSNFKTMNTITVASDKNISKNRTLSFDLNGGGTEFVLNTFKGDIYLRYHE